MAAVAFVLLVAGACGPTRARGPDRSEQLLSSTPPRGGGCAVEAYPPQLPSADAVVDSARLVAAVQGLRQPEAAPAGYVLLTLAFDGEGVNIRREVIEHSTRPSVADSVQRLVFAARRQVGEAEREWGVRLRVDLADPVAVRVGRRELCPAEARDPELRSALQGFQPAGVRYRRGIRERIVYMRAFVDESGLITAAQVVRGELRGSSLEREIAQQLRQFLFNPATVDGVPTGAWIEIPVRVRG